MASMGCRPATPVVTIDQAGPLSALLSTNRAYVGDVLDVYLRITHPAGASITWPQPGDGKQIVMRDQSLTALSTTNSLARWSVASYELGQHTVWSGTVTVVDPQGSSLVHALPPLTLNVESILPSAGAALREPKGLLKWSRAPLTRLWWALAAVAVAALLTALLVQRLMHRRRRPASAQPPEPAHEKALRALAALEKETDFERVEAESFFIAVSSIVRRYLEDRFELRAPEQTTEEFIRAAASAQALRLEHQQLVGDFLTECDLVKFARHRPGVERMRQALAAAYRLVRETAPPPPSSGGPS
jgi:hypothetical protein